MSKIITIDHDTIKFIDKYSVSKYLYYVGKSTKKHLVFDININTKYLRDILDNLPDNITKLEFCDYIFMEVDLLVLIRFVQQTKIKSFYLNCGINWGYVNYTSTLIQKISENIYIKKIINI